MNLVFLVIGRALAGPSSKRSFPQRDQRPPQQTLAAFPNNGRGPRPTDAPSQENVGLMFGLDLLVRQGLHSLATCAFVSGNHLSPVHCGADELCAANDVAVGCCPLTSPGCQINTACLDQSDSSILSTDSSGTLFCGDAASPYCLTHVYTGNALSANTLLACADSPGTDLVFRSATDTTTTVASSSSRPERATKASSDGSASTASTTSPPMNSTSANATPGSTDSDSRRIRAMVGIVAGLVVLLVLVLVVCVYCRRLKEERKRRGLRRERRKSRRRRTSLLSSDSTSSDVELRGRHERHDHYCCGAGPNSKHQTRQLGSEHDTSDRHLSPPPALYFAPKSTRRQQPRMPRRSLKSPLSQNLSMHFSASRTTHVDVHGTHLSTPPRQQQHQADVDERQQRQSGSSSPASPSSSRAASVVHGRGSLEDRSLDRTGARMPLNMHKNVGWNPSGPSWKHRHRGTDTANEADALLQILMDHWQQIQLQHQHRGQNQQQMQHQSQSQSQVIPVHTGCVSNTDGENQTLVPPAPQVPCATGDHIEEPAPGLSATGTGCTAARHDEHEAPFHPTICRHQVGVDDDETQQLAEPPPYTPADYDCITRSRGEYDEHVADGKERKKVGDVDVVNAARTDFPTPSSADAQSSTRMRSNGVRVENRDRFRDDGEKGEDVICVAGRPGLTPPPSQRGGKSKSGKEKGKSNVGSGIGGGAMGGMEIDGDVDNARRRGRELAWPLITGR